jgi:sulfoxide reductase catalytic subunit YedY
MAEIRKTRGWELSEREATPESLYLSRRRMLGRLGLGGVALAGGLGVGAGLLGVGCGGETAGPKRDVGHWRDLHRDLYPAERNARYAVSERKLSAEDKATSFNNYYEFTVDKTGVAPLAQALSVEPWTVTIAGLVPKPQTVDFDALARRFPLEERIYRFRCVEAWAMTVPWVGFPLAKLIDWVQPLSSARYLRFVTLSRPTQMPGVIDAPGYPWPYHEGLRIDEARNELSLLCTGLYGKPLPPQNGAPLRLLTPWKYGYKSIKSIVRIEFVAEQPKTFWNTLVPDEYPFLSNVDPAVPHPRWSQAQETLLNGETVPTQPYNGYGEFVAKLYG